MSVGEALAEGRRALAWRSDTAGMDAQVVLAEVAGQSREWLLAHPEAPLLPAQQSGFSSAIRRLAQGEPLPYVLGWWEFYGRRFRVTPDVLIPRPETELLVDTALEALARRPAGTRVVDLGTGSGCIAITLALESPSTRVVATDLSPAALHIARDNARRHGVLGRIGFARIDLADGIALQDAVLVANLPYVPAGEAPSLRSEPRLALEAGDDGLAHIRRLLEGFGVRQPKRTTVLLEIGAGQGGRVREMAGALCSPLTSGVSPDLAGRDRVLELEF
jgi:release factor glutamine methyltransferase